MASIGVDLIFCRPGQAVNQWFRYVTDLAEIAAAILLLVPATGFAARSWLYVFCIGALVAQIGRCMAT